MLQGAMCKMQLVMHGLPQPLLDAVFQIYMRVIELCMVYIFLFTCMLIDTENPFPDVPTRKRPKRSCGRTISHKRKLGKAHKWVEVTSKAVPDHDD